MKAPILPKIWFLWPLLIYAVCTLIVREFLWLTLLAPVGFLLLVSDWATARLGLEVAHWTFVIGAVALTFALSFWARRSWERTLWVLLFYGLNIGLLILIIRAMGNA